MKTTNETNSRVRDTEVQTREVNTNPQNVVRIKAITNKIETR